jgi:hypothetical protein
LPCGFGLSKAQYSEQIRVMNPPTRTLDVTLDRTRGTPPRQRVRTHAKPRQARRSTKALHLAELRSAAAQGAHAPTHADALLHATLAGGAKVEFHQFPMECHLASVQVKEGHARAGRLRPIVAPPGPM